MTRALDIIAQAEAVASSPGQRKAITKATELIAHGDVLLADGEYPAAADEYQKAIGRVDGVLN